MSYVKEQARIAFHHIANGEAHKAQAIQNTIEVKDYRLFDLEFNALISSGYMFSLAWARERERTENTFLRGQLDEQEYRRRMAAFDESLLVICQMYGFFPNDVRKMTGIEPQKPNPDGVIALQAHVVELVEYFKAMMDSWPGNSIQKAEAGVCVH